MTSLGHHDRCGYFHQVPAPASYRTLRPMSYTRSLLYHRCCRVAWCSFIVVCVLQAEVFATVGADGSLRMFDLRNLEHSTIMFETTNTAGSVGGGGSTGPAGGGSGSGSGAGSGGVPSLLRLSWNKQDTNFLATFSQDSSKTSILDVRMPAVAVCELGGHVTSTNGVSWAPHSSCHICTVGDDYQALIWDLSTLGTKPIEDPILAYTAEAEINNLVWSSALPDWVTIAFNNKMQILRV